MCPCTSSAVRDDMQQAWAAVRLFLFVCVCVCVWCLVSIAFSKSSESLRPPGHNGLGLPPSALIQVAAKAQLQKRHRWTYVQLIFSHQTAVFHFTVYEWYSTAAVKSQKKLCTLYWGVSKEWGSTGSPWAKSVRPNHPIWPTTGFQIKHQILML